MIHRYCAHLRYRNLARSTIKRRRHTLETFARFIDPTPILAATAADVEQYLLTRPSARTRHAYRSDLRMFFSWAVDKELVDQSPAAKIAKIKIPKSLPRPLSVAAVEHAMLVANRRTRQMLALGLYAGLRAGEIAALQAEDVWLHGTPPVIVVRDGKGGKDRSVPMHPALLGLFTSLPSSGPVFRGPHGDSIRSDSCGDTIATHLRRCGIEGTAHQLRHTFGTEAAAASGGDVIAVAELMGHESTNTTMGYVRLTAGRAAALVQSMYQPAVA